MRASTRPQLSFARLLSCHDQFLCLAFAQLAFRDIVTCLRGVVSKLDLDHAGFRGRISRSTLADVNKVHDWRIYVDFVQVVVSQSRRLYAGGALAVMLEETIYELDSTTIDQCLTRFPWAKFRRRKAEVKLHPLLDLRGNMPAFVHVSHGKVHDATLLDSLPIKPGAFWVMGRGYVDFTGLHRLTQHSAFFVTHARPTRDDTRRLSRKVDKTIGLRVVQASVLEGVKSSQLHPDSLRRVSYYDAETDRRFAFLTNNFTILT